jgi:putative transcriptional regulator
MDQYKDLFKIKHNHLPPEKGMILISEPFARDVFFQRSVVLLIDHNDAKGSMGFILNKRTNLVVNEFFAELKHLPKIPIYLGGPVSPSHLFFIHSLKSDVLPEGLKVNENLSFDGNFNILKNYLLSGKQVRGKIKFFLGYSGWIKNQLNGEIANNSWLVSRASHQSIMLADDDSYWNHSVERLGSPYHKWTHYPKNPEMNRNSTPRILCYPPAMHPIIITST